MVYTANWVIIWYLPPIKWTRKGSTKAPRTKVTLPSSVLWCPRPGVVVFDQIGDGKIWSESTTSVYSQNKGKWYRVCWYLIYLYIYILKECQDLIGNTSICYVWYLIFDIALCFDSTWLRKIDKDCTKLASVLVTCIRRSCRISWQVHWGVTMFKSVQATHANYSRHCSMLWCLYILLLLQDATIYMSFKTSFGPKQMLPSWWLNQPIWKNVLV